MLQVYTDEDGCLKGVIDVDYAEQALAELAELSKEVYVRMLNHTDMTPARIAKDIRAAVRYGLVTGRTHGEKTWGSIDK